MAIGMDGRRFYVRECEICALWELHQTGEWPQVTFPMAGREGAVAPRLRYMCNHIKDLAEADAIQIRRNAEQRGEEIYNQTVTNIRDKLQTEFAREEAEIEKNLKIREAQIKNNVKLEILKAQTEAIHESLNEALKELCTFSTGPDYPDLLKRLIVEGLNRLRETRVRIMVRKADLPIAQQVIDEAIRTAQEQNPGLTIKVKIDEGRFLQQSPSCAGGVVLIAQKGKIRVSNVLNDRLRLAYEGMLPVIRQVISTQ
jgi:V-type H+-transporting ATPase subunit E